jgi:hypothetical protein
MGANASHDLFALAQNFQSGQSTAAAAIQEPKTPELSNNLAPLDKLAVRPVGPGGLEPIKLSASPVPVRISSPAVTGSATPICASFGLESAGPASAGEISFKAVRGGPSAAIAEPAEPLPPRHQSLAFVRTELPAADRNGIPLANLAPVGETRFENRRPGDGLPLPLPYQGAPAKPFFGSSRLKLAGASLADLLHALKASTEELDRAAIHAIQVAFGQQPAVCLLSAPSEIVVAPAPAAAWIHSQKPTFSSVAPGGGAHAAVFAGPQAPPLAGPSLPPQLLNFDHQNSTLRPNRRPMSSWPISLLTATIVILGAVSLFQYFWQNRDTTAASVTTPVQVTKAAPAPHAAVVAEHPAARSVEVAGFRIVTGPNKKPQLQYIVINHSSNELTGLNIRIAVRSVDGLADAPLFSVSSIVAALGPNQSKEIRTDLNSSVPASDIPDWQSLRTEVLIARQ